MHSFFDIIILAMIWMLGAIVILQAITRKKEGEKLWAVYGEVAKELGLAEREEVMAGYGFPDVVGEIKGRKTFIHPIVGKGGGGLPKTAFAVEHKIKFNGKIMITTTKPLKMVPRSFRHKLTLANPYGKDWAFLVSGQSKEDIKVVAELFSGDALGLLSKIVHRNHEDFLYFFLESGIAILYTLDWENDKENLKNNLLDTLKLVEIMEANAPYLDPKIKSELFVRAEGKSLSKARDMFLSATLIPLGVIILVFLAPTVSDIWSMAVVVSIGLLVILIGTTRIYAAMFMKKPTSGSEGHF